MKILFVLRSTAHFYYVKSIVSSLIDRGHTVDVLCEKTKEKWLKGEYLKQLENFKKQYPNFKYGSSYPRTDTWRRFVMPARVLLNYRRFLLRKEQSQYFRDRMIKLFPMPLRLFFLLPVLRVFSQKILVSEFAARMLYKFEDMAALDKTIFEQVKNFNPDIVIVTVGGMRYGSMDLDYIKSAKALGIKSVALALTWDSLSTKGFIQVEPDLVLAWSNMHLRHAIEHHGIPKDKIAVTGSPMFDDWFDFLKKPKISREEFCLKYGLDPKNHILTYLGSASTTAPDERWLVKETREALNGSLDDRLKNAQIIFRPHPAHAKLYADMKIDKVLVLPKEGMLRDSDENMRLLYDTLTHSFCAVTVFTNAIIEAIIMDKPILALMRKEFDLTQSKAEHFKDVILSGAITPTYSVEEFTKSVGAIIDGRDAQKEKREAFVKEFIRPRGLITVVGEVTAIELEKFMGKN